MTPEVRDAIVDNIEKAFIAAGSIDYDDGIATVSKLIGWCKNAVEAIRTREHLRVLLDQVPDLPVEEEPLAVAATQFLPQLISFVVNQLASDISKDFRPHGGRPSTPDEQLVSMVRFVGAMHTDGYSMAICKRRASTRFGVSTRTVERAWQNRGRLLEGERKVSFEEVRTWVAGCLNANSAPQEISAPPNGEGVC